jgi:hypothetical protein
MNLLCFLIIITFDNITMPFFYDGDVCANMSDEASESAVSGDLDDIATHDRDDGIEMNDAFERLRWSIFEDISAIQAVDSLDTPTPELSPFIAHPIALEVTSKVPLTKIAFTIEALDNFEHPYYRSPRRVFVRREDNAPLTVQDIVEQLSVYFKTHKDGILESKDGDLRTSISTVGEDGKIYPVTTALLGDDDNISEDTRVFFDGFPGSLFSSDYALPVGLWAEGEEGYCVGCHWAQKADLVEREGGYQCVSVG